MAPKTVQFFVDQCLKSNFDHVCGLITTEKPKLDSSSAIKIINAICYACNQNLATPEKVNEVALERLLGLLLTSIDFTTDDNFESYLKSVFYILKLLEKKNVELILRLERLFLPPFKPLILTDKHIKFYKSICSALYNVIVRIVQGGPHKGAVSDLCHLLTRMCAKINNKPKLLETIHNCLVAYLILKIDPQTAFKFYKFSLNFITGVETSLFPQVVKNFDLIYNNLLKSGANDSASASYRLTIAKLEELFPGPEFQHLREIMRAVEGAPPTGAPLSRVSPDTPFITPVCEVIANVAATRLQLYKAKPEVWRAEAECHTTYFKFLGEVSVILGRFDKKGALRVLDTIASLGRLTIVGSDEIPKNYQLEVLTHLESFIDGLDAFKSHSDKWKEFWYALGVHLYTIGVHLNQKHDSELSVLYLRKFVQKYHDYQALESSIIGKNYVVAALQLISDHHLKRQEFEQCLAFIALAILFGSDPKIEIQRWILAKVAARDRNVPNVQEMTLVSALDKSELSPSVDKDRKIELLEVELRGYLKRWQSKVSMSSALDHLSQLADPVRTGRLITEVWTSGDLPFHDTFLTILHRVITNFEKVRTCPTLAHLYFLKHKYKVKARVWKHCEELERTLNDEGTEPGSDLLSCLELSNYLKMLKDLQKSLDLCRTFSKGSERFYALLIDLGHEFRLQGHTLQALEAWQLAHGQARTPTEKVESIGFIIECSDASQPYVRSLVDEADACIECLESEQNYNKLIVYFLCKSLAFFDSDFQTSYAAFKRVKNLLETCTVSDILMAKVFLTEHKFMSLPCHYGVEDHTKFTIVRIHQAGDKATEYFKQSRCSSFGVRIFFDVFEFLARMYTNLRLPLEVRSLIKSSVSVARELLLPFRTATVLFYLINADVMSMRFDDARVKIREFSDIVGLKYDDVDVNKQIDELCDVLVQLQVQESTDAGSPIFRNDTFKLPDFMRHEATCECFKCISYEYRDNVLKINFLAGLLALYEGRLTQAKNCFMIAITIYKFIKNNHSDFTKKWAKKITPDLVPNLVPFLETYCYILINWANCALKHGKISSGKKMNKIVLQNLEPLHSKLPYLSYEALAQEINIVEFEKETEKTTLQVESDDEDKNINTGVKTPENRVSTVTVSPTIVPDNADNYRIRPKLLEFVLSDEEEDGEKKGETPAKPRRRGRPRKEEKTPAPSTSKIRIYVDDGVKKGAALTENQSEEPNFKTPAPKKGANKNDVLANRTKVLTKTLRSSSQKVVEANEVRTSLFQDGGSTETCARKTRRQR
ncbi:uncharacterized protein LOC103314438 [Tribolium castaneum]|uniref:Uncharacterized protein n=1 Tax=Tribolium castaneum TaxID=7070 RepID=D6X4F3_TRICA|nr:PREDICTED: uncharacterized protein LOC103314438 [Tribolium castaneum]EEZ97548.1 hypothetical protein TcasGA2_TC011398 [Tribolium castaneum]|eukprot:XP_008198741.1 PREDICTED: uncharacterized protein LOC103314438 [Tribolium castaneum]